MKTLRWSKEVFTRRLEKQRRRIASLRRKNLYYRKIIAGLRAEREARAFLGEL